MRYTSQGQSSAFLDRLIVSDDFPSVFPLQSSIWAAPHLTGSWAVEKEPLWQFVSACSAGPLNMATTTASSNSRCQPCITHVWGRIQLMQEDLWRWFLCMSGHGTAWSKPSFCVCVCVWVDVDPHFSAQSRNKLTHCTTSLCAHWQCYT